MSAVDALAVEERGGQTILRVRVTPGAKKTGLSVRDDGLLQVRLTAPAVDGKANAALIRWLARDLLGLSRSAVRITRGERAPDKTLVIDASTAWVRERIKRALDGPGPWPTLGPHRPDWSGKFSLSWHCRPVASAVRTLAK